MLPQRGLFKSAPTGKSGKNTKQCCQLFIRTPRIATLARRYLIFAVFLMASESAGELSEQEKRELFLKAREDIRLIPRESVTPRPRPKPSPPPQKSTLPTPTPPRATPTPPKPQATNPPPSQETKNLLPEPAPDFIPLEDEIQPDTTPTPSPQPKTSPTLKPTQTQTPQPTPRPVQPPPPLRPEIKIEKSDQTDGEVIEPVKSSKTSSGWFKRYRYLTPAIRKAIDQAPVRKGRWRYIIIHNSGTRQGSARAYDSYHRKVRKMKNGLAYHFVIGNGNGAGNGQIEIGPRWTSQLSGGHVASDYLNNISIGICLTGDFNRHRPTPAQMAALEELVDYLRRRIGRIGGRQAAVRGHKEINPKPTDCPGNLFDLRWLRRRFGF